MKTLNFSRRAGGATGSLCVVSALALFAAQPAALASEPPGGTSGTIAAESQPKLPYGVGEVLKLSRARISEDVIVNYIQNSGTVYNLTPNDILYLRKEGVSDRVMNAMLDQRQRVLESSQNQAAAAPAPATAPAPAAAPPQEAPVPANPAPVYVQPPAEQAPSTVYVIPYPSASSAYYGYYSPYPYYGYYGGYYGPYYYGPSISLGFGFGGGYWGGRYGGWRGHYGGYYGGHYRGHYGGHGGGFHGRR